MRRAATIGVWAAVAAVTCGGCGTTAEQGAHPAATGTSEVRKPGPPAGAASRGRTTERLDRGLVALPAGGDRVYLSWRRLASDPADLGFDVFRRTRGGDAVRINDQPVVRTTDFLDAGAAGGSGCTWWVRSAADAARLAEVSLGEAHPAGAAAAFRSVRLSTNTTFAKAAVGDLDGDGRLDFVIKRPGASIDPYEKYWKPSPSTYTLEALSADGRALWSKDLGWAIEQGIWYSPYIVFDLDGDGCAEVIAKTGEGDPRDADGRVQGGPEHVTVFDGRTGRVLARADWPERGLFEGQGAYNYASRNQLGVAFLDGRRPSLIVERGTYRRIVVDAWVFDGRSLRKMWRWDNENESPDYRGQGAHELRAAEVDGDGRDEIILGSCALDDNGKSLWTTGLGHPDACYVGDLDPARPGLEIYYNIERAQAHSNGMCMAEAATGRLLWGHRGATKHIHSQGMCGDVLASSPGWECYGGERDNPLARWFRDCRGAVLSTNDLGGLAVRTVYWDADPQREVIRGKGIGNLDPGQPAELPAGIEGDVVMVADLIGDWREEIVTSVAGELRIYSTLIPAVDRRVCLLSDPIYRLDVVQASSGYYQVPMMSRAEP